MYLTTQQIEDMAAAILHNFRNTTGLQTVFTPIDQFASNYLGLSVKFAKLSEDGSICGLTAYADTNYSVRMDGREYVYPIQANDVLLDSSFIDMPEHCMSQCGKRRFTLAHECAHQILFGLESEEAKALHKKKYSERRSYSCRELKSREDWNEWQANALGAALLMPADSLSALLQGYRLISYDGRMTQWDQELFEEICHLFGVSHSAMMIRLEKLGLMIRRPISQFPVPEEVTA